MSDVNLEIFFFGHYYNPENNNDKIWGWLSCNGKLYNFWGRRGNADTLKKLTFKRNFSTDTWGNPLQSLSRSKVNKGYTQIPLNKDANGVYVDIEQTYPGFSEHVRNELMFARLTSTVKNEA